MSGLYIFLMVLHVAIASSLVAVILAQSSKGGALDGMLGGAASNVLGGEGASKFLQKITRVLASLFMISSILLAFQVKQTKTASASKIMEQYKKEAVDKSAQQNNTEALPPIEQPKQSKTDNK